MVQIKNLVALAALTFVEVKAVDLDATSTGSSPIYALERNLYFYFYFFYTKADKKQIPSNSPPQLSHPVS